MAVKNVIFGNDTSVVRLGSVALTCFILEGHLRVFDRESIGTALGYQGKFHNWLYDFLVNIKRYLNVPQDLLERLQSDAVAFSIGGIETKKALRTQDLFEACQYIV